MNGTNSGTSRDKAVGSYFTTDAMAARAKAEAQTKRDQDRADRGIPEQRQMSRSPIALLLEQGRIPAHSARAAGEIAQLAYIQAADVRGRITAAYFERLAPSTGTDYPEHIQRMWRERWSPWVRWAGGPWAPGARAKVVGDARTTYLELTINIAAYDHTLRAVANRAGCHHSTALKALRDSLAWYAQQAGWVAEHPMRESLDVSAVSGLENVTLANLRPAA